MHFRLDCLHGIEHNMPRASASGALAPGVEPGDSVTCGIRTGMKCPECGARIRATGDRCPRCGWNSSGTRDPGKAGGRGPWQTIGGMKTLGPGGAEVHIGQGTRIKGRYRVVRLLGEGGMGVVYKALDESLNRVVAVKRLRSATEAGRPAVERFHREAEAVASLEHPNIVRIYDLDDDGHGPFIVAEFVDGPTLSEYILLHGGLTEQEALDLFEPIARAVSYAHTRTPKIIHRDIKPANVLLQQDEEGGCTPKLTDFGLARMGVSSSVLSSSVGVGTGAYVAPEQRQSAKNADERSDIYSLGKLLYEMWTGDVPVNVDYALVDRKYHPLLQKALRTEPSGRYHEVEAMLDDLLAAAKGTPVAAPEPKQQEPDWSCSGCGTMNSAEDRYCARCGLARYVTCPECGSEQQQGREHCTACGARLRIGGPKPEPAPPPPPHVAPPEETEDGGPEPGIDQLAREEAIDLLADSYAEGSSALTLNALGQRAKAVQIAETVHPYLRVPVSSFQIDMLPVSVADFMLFYRCGVYHEPTTDAQRALQLRIWTEHGLKWRDETMPGRDVSNVYRLTVDTREHKALLGVSWYEAVAYCNWKSIVDCTSPRQRLAAPVAYPPYGGVDLDGGYRLPTEAELEIALAATRQQPREQVAGESSELFGDLSLDAVLDRPKAVRTDPRAWEWVGDSWLPDHLRFRDKKRDPSSFFQGTRVVLVDVNSHGVRKPADPSERIANAGFRCVRRRTI